MDKSREVSQRSRAQRNLDSASPIIPRVEGPRLPCPRLGHPQAKTCEDTVTDVECEEIRQRLTQVKDIQVSANDCGRPLPLRSSLMSEVNVEARAAKFQYTVPRAC